MAYVAISGNTVTEIREKIRTMARAELNSLGEVKLTLDETDCDDIERLVWGEHYPLLATLPAEWVRKSTDVMIRFRRDADRTDPDNPVHPFNEVLSVPTPRPLRVPPKGSKANGYKFDEHYGERGVLQGSHTALRAERVEPVLAHFALKASVQWRWAGVESQVVKFVEGAKSLNEAIKLWPQLDMYVPAHLMAKVMEKKSSTKSTSRAAELLKQLDTEAAIASATLARLAASSAS